MSRSRNMIPWKILQITLRYSRIFNNKLPARWVAHVTKDFLTSYYCSYYISMLTQRNWFFTITKLILRFPLASYGYKSGSVYYNSSANSIFLNVLHKPPLRKIWTNKISGRNISRCFIVSFLRKSVQLYEIR